MATFLHELVVMWLARTLGAWARRRQGYVAGSEAKIAVGSRRGRKPDLSLYLRGKAPALADSLVRIPPHLVVEVISPRPRDARRDRVEKIGDYAGAGISCRLGRPRLRQAAPHDLAAQHGEDLGVQQIFSRDPERRGTGPFPPCGGRSGWGAPPGHRSCPPSFDLPPQGGGRDPQSDARRTTGDYLELDGQRAADSRHHRQRRLKLDGLLDLIPVPLDLHEGHVVLQLQRCERLREWAPRGSRRRSRRRTAGTTYCRTGSRSCRRRWVWRSRQAASHRSRPSHTRCWRPGGVARGVGVRRGGAGVGRGHRPRRRPRRPRRPRRRRRRWTSPRSCRNWIRSSSRWWADGTPGSTRRSRGCGRPSCRRRWSRSCHARSSASRCRRRRWSRS